MRDFTNSASVPSNARLAGSQPPALCNTGVKPQFLLVDGEIDREVPPNPVEPGLLVITERAVPHDLVECFEAFPPL